MKPYRPPSRALTTCAVGFLALDALLLAYSGFSLGRPLLVVWAVVCLVGMVLVIIGWRHYRRAMADLDRARREMRAEVESIRDLLHDKHLHN
ncbi:MAG TPA: hypothetical protein VEM13_01250 [Gemmatimonadales bacterium]|nr:hypothetical protein [Gemmatimonadales bacterium]